MRYKKNREVRRMVSALNVGNNLLARSFKENIDITPMKLQKLIYFVYKKYLKETDRPLFSERFEVWKYGPVIRTVYDEFKDNGSNKINRYYKECDSQVLLGNEVSSFEFKKALDYVWNKYKSYDGITLSTFTHMPGTAWRKALDNDKYYLEDSDIANEEEIF